MNTSADNPSKFCPQCGHPIGDRIRFCENCGASVASEPVVPSSGVAPPKFESAVVTGNRSSRGRRVMQAMGIVAAAVIVIGGWIVATWKPSEPVEPQRLPTSEEAFPIEPVGVDSINNTIDGKKVAIEGDGHIMNSPGLGVNRPVWCLVGPTESVFTVPVAKGMQEGLEIFAPGFQVLVPVLREEVENPKEVDLRLSLIDLNGDEIVTDYRLKGENRWQPLDVTFPYDSARAPFQLRFEARGFKGAIYIDRLAREPETSKNTQP